MAPELLAIALIAGHFLGDYPLQGEFLAAAKNRAHPVPGVPWYHALAAHAAIHGAIVAFATGIWWLFFAEALIHFITDDAKCNKRLSFDQDQAIHIACKIGWFGLAVGIT